MLMLLGLPRRCTLKLVMEIDVVEMVGTPAAALLLAYLHRLAREPSLLELQIDPASALDRSRHRPKGRICHGCPKCDGPIWAHKTQSVAVLWANFCEYLCYSVSMLSPSLSPGSLRSVHAHHAICPPHCTLASCNRGSYCTLKAETFTCIRKWWCMLIPRLKTMSVTWMIVSVLCNITRGLTWQSLCHKLSGLQVMQQPASPRTTLQQHPSSPCTPHWTAQSSASTCCVRLTVWQTPPTTPPSMRALRMGPMQPSDLWMAICLLS